MKEITTKISDNASRKKKKIAAPLKLKKVDGKKKYYAKNEKKVKVYRKI